MARIEHGVRTLVSNAMNQADQQKRIIESALSEIDNFDKKYAHINFDGAKVTTLKAELRTKAKSAFEEMLKWELWLAGKVPSVSVPTAYTDAEVDAIDPEIRTFDDA